MKEILDKLVIGGEGQRVEFKSSIARLDREMVAFANSIGGTIWLGITDEGVPCGTSMSNHDLSTIADIAKNCDPSIKIEIKKHPAQKVLEILVPESINKPHSCSSGFFTRVGPNSQKLTRLEIIALLDAAGRTHYDGTVIEGYVHANDTDPVKLQNLRNLARVPSVMDDESALVTLGLAEIRKSQLAMRTAGVLFLAKYPQRFVKESLLTLIRYASVDRTSMIDRKDFDGDLFSQIDRVLDSLKDRLAIRYRITGDARRSEFFDYPPVALREAVINAVMHRDYYYDASRIYMHWHPDRLEIENPGGLYPGIDVQDLGKRSVRRNPTIADVLFRCRYVENVGSGIPRIRAALAQNQNPPFEAFSGNVFIIRMFPSLTSRSDQSLTDRQRRIIGLIRQNLQMTKSQISSQLGVSEDTALRELGELLKHKFLKRTGRGKATVYVLED